MTDSKIELSRREALLQLGLGVSGCALAPGLLASNPTPLSRSKRAKCLVVLQLSGGNDGLNTVVPLGDSSYHQLRPTLGLRAKDCLELEPGTGLHGSMPKLHELFGSARLAVVQGVGYPQPNRSHFKSMDIWHSADPSGTPKTSGWLGRAADLLFAEDAGLAGVGTLNLSSKPPLALHGEVCRPLSFVDPRQFKFQGSKDEQSAYERMTATSGDDAQAEVLALIHRTAGTAAEASDDVRKSVADYATPVKYPGGRLAQNLKTIAALDHAGFGSRIYYLYHGSFDTHANQLNRQARLLADLDAALGAFQSDLERTDAADRMTTFAFSEFGRRAQENGSRGTDHGKAGPSFLLGKDVAGGVHGDRPDLEQLDQGDVRHGVDFRSIYQSLLVDSLGVDSEVVLGERFKKLPLFKRS